MPSRTLPNYMAKEVGSHKTAESCWVTIGSKVYDMTNFLGDHPGGGDLILKYGGKDVGAIMKDEISHNHSESAYDYLEENLIGFVATDPILKTAVESGRPQDILPLPPNESGAHELRINGAADHVPTQEVCPTTGMSSVEDMFKETDIAEDYRTHKFLNLEKPLLMQVWNGGFSKDFYLAQVHRPRVYDRNKSPPLFGNFLEPLSKTAWYVVPIVWLPCVAYGSWLAYLGIPSWVQFIAFWLTGFVLWSLVEYGMHRGLFHVDKYLPDNRVAITGHFLLHGIHHYIPMDKYRLVMPPTLFVVLATPFYKLAHTVFYWDWHVATAVYCGGIFGLPSYYQQLRSYHMEHHWKDYGNGFGVTSRFWDCIFGTELVMPIKTVKVS
ncbi:MAG: hypothetical protein Q9201_004190 [Fulgogasparrea decipioides]